jgi:phenylalanyl-tRNA synthetase beta chain
MKLSVSWLKDYVDIKNPYKTAGNLTMSIAEVEEVEDLAKKFKGVVVGEVLEKKKHLNADKLSLTKVKVGAGKILEIICGAQNVAQGQKVAVAQVGTILPNGMKIESREIRGIKSFGMICSERELGLAKKSEGIMVLSADARVGEPFGRYLGLDDVVFNIDNKSLTHRSDLLSHIGIAREITAKEGKKLKTPKVVKLKIKGKAEKINVKVREKDLCPRYMAIKLDNIKIGSSPKWMQSRLNAAGMRPINNVVDITNYVMLEYGQPLHAFDAEKCDKHIIVRRAKKGESIVTIDDKKRQLDDSMLVIADEVKPIAIAGVMGGGDLEVSKSTTSIILESANFNGYSIRQTARKLGIHSEAATRFEKKITKGMAAVALSRAVGLFQDISRAKIASKITDVYPQKAKPIKISFDLKKLEEFLGQKIPITKVKSILKSLEFKVSGAKNLLKVEVPYFRMDIHIPEDLYEEIARVYGYDNIKPREMVQTIKPVEPQPDLYWRQVASNYLSNWGLSEVYNYSFYSERLLSKCGFFSRDHISLLNPQSPDLKYLRTSLLPWLFENLEKNVKQFDDIKIFEIGKVFVADCEGKMLSGVLCVDDKNVFYQAKGLVESLFKKLNVDYQFEILQRKEGCEYWNIYRVGRSLQIKSGEKFLGTISELDRDVATNFDLSKKYVAFFDLFFEEIAELSGKPEKYKPLPKFPEVLLDLAIILDKKIPAEKVEKLIYEAGKPLLQKVELFDVYVGKPLLPSEKNFAFHLTYQAFDRTLKDFEAKEAQKKIITRLQKEIGAKVRA